MHFTPIRVVGFLVCFAFGCFFFFVANYVDFQSIRQSRLPSPFSPSYPPFHRPDMDAGINEEESNPASNLLWASRASSVKEAFLHAYSGYLKYAPFPADELRPLSNTSVQNFNGWGVTLVDAMDTMLLMDLKQEFASAVAQVSTLDFTMKKGQQAPFFETTIRYLGGFLSAYALSNETILLSLAERLGTQLLPAFKTQSGLPAYSVDTRTGSKSSSSTAYLAEIGSCQLEYKYLSYMTGRKEFFYTPQKVMGVLAKTQSPINNMWPTVFSLVTGSPSSNVYTVGGLSDSTYEYLLKQYLLSNQTETELAELYMSSISGIIENLLYLSPTRQFLYVTDTNAAGDPSGKFEHLSCFLPGLLALGASTLSESVMTSAQRELHMWAAEGLGHSCWLMYAERQSGLGPEDAWVQHWSLDEQDLKSNENKATVISQAKKRGRWMTHVNDWDASGRLEGKPPGLNDPTVMIGGGKDELDYYVGRDSYLLRPETLESMYVLYRTTKDPKWRDRGWQIWDSVVKNTRTPSGFATAMRLNYENPILEDSMPSYFLSETIKYAYLLTLDDDPIPMSSFVLNTEAHPLPIFDWRDWEKRAYNIGEN